MLFLGIDGGGTKTAFIVCDQNGKILGKSKKSSTVYHECGADGLRKIILEGTSEALSAVSDGINNLAGVCFGVACWGESDIDDDMSKKVICETFGKTPVLICNDSEVGWAGSLGLESGINVVAGTGSIAFGRDRRGNTFRSGGWSEFIGDEGSGHWLGIKLLQLFCMESDGRLPKGILYHIVKEKLQIKNDFEIIKIVHRDFLPERDKTASLQMLLYETAVSGDEAAVQVFSQAAKELAALVITVKKGLNLTGSVPVSYSGSIFKAGGLIMDSFNQIMHQNDCELRKPLMEPWKGALLLAVEAFGKDHLAGALEGLKKG